MVLINFDDRWCVLVLLFVTLSTDQHINIHARIVQEVDLTQTPVLFFIVGFIWDYNGHDDQYECPDQFDVSC